LNRGVTWGKREQFRKMVKLSGQEKKRGKTEWGVTGLRAVKKSNWISLEDPQNHALWGRERKGVKKRFWEEPV